MEDFQFQEALKERMAVVRQQQDTVQSQLDEKAESLQARFADTSVGLKHDVDRLEGSLSIQPKVIMVMMQMCENFWSVPSLNLYRSEAANRAWT